jgi:23S rRNA (uridine2552-2'-O)-methyltransferase
MYRRKDAYYLRAKTEGYRSRAAYKLLDLQRRYRILRTGDRVIDLGAAPGAWAQVASELVGPNGHVVAVDLVAMTDLGLPNVSSIVGDILDPATRDAAVARLGRAPNVVLSDMAPKLTGIGPRDEVRCADLEHAALDLAVATLAPAGRVLIKLMTDGQSVASAHEHFAVVKTTRPPATRKGSSEAYLVATGFRAESRERLR